MTLKEHIKLLSFVGTYIGITMAPMILFIAANYYYEPDRAWGTGLSDGREAAIIVVYMLWAGLSLVTAARFTGIHNEEVMA